MRPDAKLIESPGNGRWAESRERTRNGQRQAEREMEAEEARNGRPRHIQRAFHSQNQGCSLRPLPRKGKGERLRAGRRAGRGELIPPLPSPGPSILQNHLTPPPSPPSPLFRDHSPPPSNQDQPPTPHYHLAQGPWCPSLKHPSHEL